MSVERVNSFISRTIEALRKKLRDAFEEGVEYPPGKRVESEKRESVVLSDLKNITIDSDRKEIRGEYKDVEEDVEKYGTDALAWYNPFHFYKKWGIFIRWRGVEYLSNFFLKYSSLPLYKLIELVKFTLYFHECFHFLTEWASTFLELRYAVMPSKAQREEEEYPPPPFYKNYTRRVGTPGEHLNYEESLANSYAYRKLKWPGYRHAEKFFITQPAPYCDFKQYISDLDFLKGERRLGLRLQYPSIAELVSLRLNPETVTQYELLFGGDKTETIMKGVPIHLVYEGKPIVSPVFRFIARKKNVRIAWYIGDHDPPHIHVNNGRYLWDSLKPLKDDPPLTKKQRNAVRPLKPKIEKKMKQRKRWRS